MSNTPTTDNDWLLLYNQQSWTEIKSAYEAIASTDLQSVSPNIVFFYIISLFHLGLFSDAVAASRSSYSLLKHLPEFFATWGAAARRNGDLDASNEIFQEAIQLFPDDSILANNYANLLIDTRNFSEARNLLNNALLSNPSNIADIKANLSRIDNVQQSQDQDTGHQVSLNGSTYDLPVAIDPLLYAFSTPEVKHHDDRNASESLVKPNFSDQELQERIKLARSIASTNAKAALKDIQELYIVVGAKPSLYSIAADAYIALKMFKEAEICCLTSIALGSSDSSLFINLSNFAHMRKEVRLANAYIDMAIKSGADKALIKNVKKRQGTPDNSGDRIAPFLPDSLAV